MAPELITLFFVFLGVAAVAIASYLNYKQGLEAQKSWEKVAKAISGSYTSGTIDGSSSSMELNAVVGEKLVTATLFRSGLGKNKVVATSISAFAGTENLRIQIHRKGAISHLPTVLFGMSTIKLDDADFDRAFKVVTNDATRAKLWLDEDIRRALLGTMSYSFEIAENEARAILGSIDGDEKRLTSVMAAVSTLAGGGQRLIENLEAISKEVGAPLERVASEALSGFEYRLKTPSVTVTVDMVQQFVGVITVKTLTWTRIRAENQRNTAPFIVRSRKAPEDAVDATGLEVATPLSADEGFRKEFEIHVESADRVDELFSTELLQGIAATSPTLLASDGEEITALVEDYLTEKDRLRALVELVAKLAGRPLAPYR